MIVHARTEIPVMYMSGLGPQICERSFNITNAVKSATKAMTWVEKHTAEWFSTRLNLHDLKFHTRVTVLHTRHAHGAQVLLTSLSLHGREARVVFNNS